MGRKPTVNLNLPERMRARVRGEKTYYTYDQGGKPRREVSLGTDYLLAIQKWAELHESTPTEKLTVGWAIAKYLNSPAFDQVSSGTQADYRFALDKLAAKFGNGPLDEVRPSHIQLYLDERGRQSRHRALREKAVFSMLFGWCMARDFCKDNPVAAIKTKRLPGRKAVYITDDMLEAVYKHASPSLRDAIDLAYFLGQRPGDVLKLTEADIRGGTFDFSQAKTGKPMMIKITGQLEELINRMNERKAKFAVRRLQLLVDEVGKPMTKAKLRARFEAAREAAGIGGDVFQFRDLRRKAASDLRDQAGIEAAQALLGHSSVTMTEHYAAGKAREVEKTPSRKR